MQGLWRESNTRAFFERFDEKNLVCLIPCANISVRQPITAQILIRILTKKMNVTVFASVSQRSDLLINTVEIASAFVKTAKP